VIAADVEDLVALQVKVAVEDLGRTSQMGASRVQKELERM